MLSSLVLAAVYAGIGIAPLVYTYVAARRARSEYEHQVEAAIVEPIVPVHVVVVVREDDVDVHLVKGGVDVTEKSGVLAEETLPLHEDGEAVDILSIRHDIEGVEAPSAVQPVLVQEEA